MCIIVLLEFINSLFFLYIKPQPFGRWFCFRLCMTVVAYSCGIPGRARLNLVKGLFNYSVMKCLYLYTLQFL